MVQTRSQTQAGAPAPPSLWPDAVQRSAQPPAAPPQPTPITLINVLTTQGGTAPSLPVIASLYQYLNGVDRAILGEAIPQIGDALYHPFNPPPSFQCQDCPPLPATRQINPLHVNHTIPQALLGARQRCDIPGNSMVRQEICEGPRLGYNNHGPRFWVCTHCARRSWERYSLAVNPICYDLCLNCSQNYRRANPIAALNECLCQWEHRDAQLHLCTECRITRSIADHTVDLNLLKGYNSNMIPMHLPNINAPNIPQIPQPDSVADFISQHGIAGESSCTCGRDVNLKIGSYFAPTAPAGQVWNFLELVRICSHCRKEKFLTLEHPF